MERTRNAHALVTASLALALACVVASRANAQPVSATAAQGKDCSQDSTGLVPLNDLGSGSYLDSVGGLYGGGSNQCPYGHAFDGLAIANAIVPRDTMGAVDKSAGRVVLLSLGGNNANLQFAQFMTRLAADGSRNPNVLAVNGAAAGYDLLDAANPQSSYWDTVATRLRLAGCSPAQAQVAWMTFYVEGSLGGFQASTDSTAALLASAIRNARARLPNLRQLYLTPGIYAGYANNSGLTEPGSYWTGFAFRQVILSQVSGASLNFDPARGAVDAPWIDWGPYLWADGRVPRSDGLTWPCTAYTGNGNVPSQSGRAQFADSLVAFMRSGTASATWYLARPTLDVGGATGPAAPRAAVRVTPNPASSVARLSVSGAKGEWTLRVMDLQGRTTRIFAGTGPADVSWDLRDREGVRVRAGFYWAQLRTPDGNFSRAVVVR